MSIFDTLEKRHHVVRYKPEAPPKELIEKVLWEAWKITPSKNNAMAYKVTVLGPDKLDEKIKIWSKVSGNDYSFYEKTKIKTSYKFKINPFFEHARRNPYLLVFSSRICPKPNKFYQKMSERQEFFAESCDPNSVLGIAENVAVEIGFYATALSALCIENSIDVSFCGCISKNPNNWKDTPYLWYDKEKKLARVHLIMSLGYAEKFRYEWLHTNKLMAKEDVKPEMEEVVKWI